VPITIVVADDHPLVLDGLERLFSLEPDLQVVARCRDGRQALDDARRLRPDVLVLDVAMPIKNGLDVLRELHNDRLPTRVVLLTAALEDEQLLEAIQLGAQGVVLKDMAPNLLIEAVREVHGGGQWFEKGLGGRALRRLLQREQSQHETGGALTKREIEIVRMVARGLRNKAIADQLFISEGTVKVHVHNIYEKLAVDGRAALIVYARSRGLV